MLFCYSDVDPFLRVLLLLFVGHRPQLLSRVYLRTTSVIIGRSQNRWCEPHQLYLSNGSALLLACCQVREMQPNHFARVICSKTWSLLRCVFICYSLLF